MPANQRKTLTPTMDSLRPMISHSPPIPMRRRKSRVPTARRRTTQQPAMPIRQVAPAGQKAPNRPVTPPQWPIPLPHRMTQASHATANRKANRGNRVNQRQAVSRRVNRGPTNRARARLNLASQSQMILEVAIQEVTARELASRESPGLAPANQRGPIRERMGQGRVGRPTRQRRVKAAEMTHRPRRPNTMGRRLSGFGITSTDRRRPLGLTRVMI